MSILSTESVSNHRPAALTVLMWSRSRLQYVLLDIAAWKQHGRSS